MASVLSFGKTPEDTQVYFSPKSMYEIREGVNASGSIRNTYRLSFDPKMTSATYNYELWLNGKSAVFGYNPTLTASSMRTSIKNTLNTLAGDTAWDVIDTPGITLTNLFGERYNFEAYRTSGIKDFRLYVRQTNLLPRLIVDRYTAGAVNQLISGLLTKFEYSESTAVVDKTGVNEKHEYLSEGRSSMAFNISILDDERLYIPEYLLYAGATGIITVYENNARVGTGYGQFYAIIEEVKKPYAEDAVKEYTIRGRRIGAPLKPFGSIVA